MKSIRKYIIPIFMFSIFEIIAIILWLTRDNIFYLLNFSYIGFCISFGLILYENKFKYARLVVQFCVGTYMLVYLGLICNENMQIEGFWYYLLLGVFEAATIHYVVAKILGPLIFGRGWCGYACWTAMVLDLLPYKIPEKPRQELGYIRYIIFVLSFLFTGALFVFNIPNLSRIMFWSFIIGNIVYYIVGIALAFLFKDNRSFCKYICPITIFLKPASYFSLMRIKNDEEKCIDCGICKSICPMDVNMIDNSRKRINGTECILCMACIEACPQKSLYM